LLDTKIYFIKPGRDAEAGTGFFDTGEVRGGLEFFHTEIVLLTALRVLSFFFSAFQFCCQQDSPSHLFRRYKQCWLCSDWSRLHRL